MKLFFRINITIFLLIMLRCCIGLFYLRVAHLEPDDLKWINKSKDLSGVLVSSTGQRIKLYTYSHYISNDQSPIYFTFAGGSDYNDAYAIYSYIVQKNSKKYDGSLTIYKDGKSDSLSFRAGFENMYAGGPLTSKYVHQATILNQPFDDCIIVNETNSHVSYRHPDDTVFISEYILSKRYGPLYFKFDNDEEFIREFIVKRAKSIQQDTILSPNKDI